MRLYKFSTIHNIPTVDVIDVLKEYFCKSFRHTSLLSEEMIELLEIHFNSEIIYNRLKQHKYNLFSASSKNIDFNDESIPLIDYGSVIKHPKKSILIVQGILNGHVCEVPQSIASDALINDESTKYLVMTWYLYFRTDSGYKILTISKEIEHIPLMDRVKYLHVLLKYLSENEIDYVDDFNKEVFSSLFANLNSNDANLLMAEIDFEYYWLNIDKEIPLWVLYITEILLDTKNYRNLKKKRNTLLRKKKDEEEKEYQLMVENENNLLKARQERIERNKKHYSVTLKGTGINVVIDSWGRALFYEKSKGSWLNHKYVSDLIRGKRQN